MARQEVTLSASAGTEISLLERVVLAVGGTYRRRSVSIKDISASVNTFDVNSDPWDREVFGLFNDDPSWRDFPRWRRENRSKTDMK